jgi:hypothetical protein
LSADHHQPHVKHQFPFSPDPEAFRSYGIIYSGTNEAKARAHAMPTDVIQERHQVHELIDRLVPSQLAAVRGVLEAMLDPVARAIANAPADDEPVTEEEKRALVEAREWLRHNKPIPHEQVLVELGVTQEEIDDYKEPA